MFQKGDIVRYNNPDFPEFNGSLGIVDDRPSTWTPIIWLAPTRTPNDTFDMGAKTDESPDVLELVMRGEPDAIR